MKKYRHAEISKIGETFYVTTTEKTGIDTFKNKKEAFNFLEDQGYHLVYVDYKHDQYYFVRELES